MFFAANHTAVSEFVCKSRVPHLRAALSGAKVGGNTVHLFAFPGLPFYVRAPAVNSSHDARLNQTAALRPISFCNLQLLSQAAEVEHSRDPRAVLEILEKTRLQ